MLPAMVWTEVARRAGLDIPSGGFVAPGYEPVRDTFLAHLRSGEDAGACVAVFRDGVPVVDLWGGWADRGGLARPPRPWLRDTLAVIFSATKGLTALLLMQLAERGRFDYDDRVADHWPEFAAAGKGDITIRTLLNHRAGLPGVDAPLSFDDVTDPSRVRQVARVLEAQAPAWAPGTAQAYHATTYGLYARELLRRLEPELDVSRHFRAEIAEPLGAELWLGAPPEVDARIAELYPPAPTTRVRGMAPSIARGAGADGHVGREFLTPGSTVRRAFLNPLVPRGDLRIYNELPARRTPLLWASGVGNARGLARVYAALARGGEAFGARVVKAGSLAAVHARQSWSERDRVLGKPVGWSQGFLKEEAALFCPNPESFGHAGLGGSLGWADPVTGTSFGYVTNTLDWRVRSRRCIALCHALYGAPALRG
jgi:CubicO group peptidase (beta-lactamase class C family)